LRASRGKGKKMKVTPPQLAFSVLGEKGGNRAYPLSLLFTGERKKEKRRGKRFILLLHRSQRRKKGERGGSGLLPFNIHPWKKKKGKEGRKASSYSTFEIEKKGRRRE